MYKVIYIDKVSEHGANIPSNINDGDNYFTIGWGGICARKFKEYNPGIKVECWKTDYKAKKIYNRNISGVEFKIFPAFHIKYFGDYSKTLLGHLKRELTKKEPIIVNITSFRHLLFYSLAARLKENPLVVQNNGESSAIYKLKISKGLKKLLYLLHIPLEEKSFKYIDLLYILDERIKDSLPHTKAVIKKQTLGIIPERFKPLDKKEARRLLKLEPDKKYLLYIGRLNSTKNPDLLIDLYKDIKKVRDDVDLLIAGTNEKDPLIGYAKDAGAKIYGRIPHTDIYKYLSAADVYILPKYSLEHIFGGVGLLPIESLLCNTPIIGSNVQNIPKEFRDLVGIVASERDEIKNAIINIIDKKQIFKDLREVAIKLYSWENIIKSTSNDYQQLINKYYKYNNMDKCSE